MFFRRQKAPGNDNRPQPIEPPAETGSASTVIAAGTTVSGNIESEHDVRIDGTVRGSVRAEQVTIGHDGVVEGDVGASSVTVRGYVKGPIHARHVHLEADSTVEGDLSTATIAIDKGARLSGTVWQEQADGQVPAGSPLRDGAREDGFISLAAMRTRLTDQNR